MKPDVKKIIADIKATKGNRKFCNGLAGTLQDDNYASSICKYVKTVTPERIDLLIEYAEKLEAEVTDMAVQLANAESKCRELAAENAGLKSFGDKLNEMHNDLNGEGTGIQGRAEVACQQVALEAAMEEFDAIKTPATDAFLAEVRAQGVKSLSNAVQSVIAERQRHQSVEGWTPEHDDQYSKSQLLWASSCYVLNAIHPFNRIPFGWPWTPEWWKPTNPRRDLVKAGALILAEIERIDRQEAAQ
ncbi:TPA: hypothetical protein J0C76_005232 [Escherichia coli]|nr:hypothetical protein [Escherichia coli]